MPLNAQQALQTLPPLQAVGDVFKAVFGIYHRKLSKLIDAVLLRVAMVRALFVFGFPFSSSGLQAWFGFLRW